MLILLDIDGVMVSAKAWTTPQALEDGFYAFSKKAVNALNSIIAKSNAQIVLTTSHKDNFTIKEWVKIFKNRGVNIDRISKLASNHNYLNRKEEIINWFSTSEDVEDFVIIDDDKSLNGLLPILKDRLILTKPFIGLTSNHVQDTIRILETPLERV